MGTIGEALSRFFDLQGVVRVATASQLIPYINDEKQKSWLQNIVAKENREKFKAIITVPCRSIVSLLTNELSSCRVPLADLLHILPFMQPRYYTISSSSSRFPDTVHITVSITDYATADGNRFVGVTSRYLSGLQAHTSRCRIFVRPSTFKLPKKITTPIVMIGPGTGIAPMRALLQEREEQTKQTGKNGSNVLYFGCQSVNKDFIYRDELETFQRNNTLSQLELAFSRDQAHKVYVQHLLQRKEDAAALMNGLESGAYVYVCGATSMGTDVMEAVTDIVQKSKRMSRSGAEGYLKELQGNGRYVQELWSA